MKKYDFKEPNFVINDPVENYFECISSCDINDGICFSQCLAILKNDES